MSLSKCSAWVCRHKEPQKCGTVEVIIHEGGLDGNVDINLCGQCLADALEEVE